MIQEQIKMKCPEHEIISCLKQEGIAIPYGEGNGILNKMAIDFLIYYPEFRKLKTCSDLVKAMRLNGWWSRDKFLEYVPAAFLPEDREKNLEAA